MRRALHGDVAAAARVLRLVPRARRASVMAQLIAEAETGDVWRRVRGVPHPTYGGGSLMAAAGRYPRAAEPDFSDADYCSCWIVALRAVRRSARG